MSVANGMSNVHENTVIFQLKEVSKKCSAKSIIQTFSIEMISPLSQVNVDGVVVVTVGVELVVVIISGIVVGQESSSLPDGQSLIPSHTCVHYKYRKQNRLKIGLS